VPLPFKPELKMNPASIPTTYLKMLLNLRILTKNKDPIVLTLTISFKNSFLTQTRRNAYLRYNPTPVRCGKKLSRNKNHKILSKNYRINGTIEIGINKLVKNYRILVAKSPHVRYPTFQDPLQTLNAMSNFA
jgi:hypothetical protein